MLRFVICPALGVWVALCAATVSSNDFDAEVFKPVSDEEVQVAKSLLSKEAEALSTAFARLPDQGQAWRDYLRWDSIAPLTQPGAEVDIAALQASFYQLNSGAPGLELPVFRDAAEAVRRLRDISALARSRDQRTAYERRVQLLEKLLERDPHATDPRHGYQIERLLDFVAGVNRSPSMVRAIRQDVQRSNAWLSVSERLLDRLVRRSVVTQEPIRDTILGARVVGHGDTQAWLSVATAPSDSSAQLVFSLKGAIQSETTGYKGPVAVRSLANTPIEAYKTVRLTPDEFLIMPASASATTRSHTRSIRKTGNQFAAGVIEKLAKSRVAKEKSQADRIASRRAEVRVASSFDQRVEEAVRDFRREFDNNWTKPLARYGARPARFELKTTSDTLEAQLLQADRGQFGASTPPPSAPDADVCARVHPSLVHNLGTALLGGATIRKPEANEPPKLSVPLPEWLDELIPEETDPVAGDEVADGADDEAADKAPAFRPWSIRLRAVRPLSVEVEDGAFRLYVHAAQIDSEGNSYRGWDIILAYAPSHHDGVWRLDRRGEIGVLPTAFDPKSGKSLKGREVALRRNLAKALNDAAEAGYGIPNSLQLADIDLSRFERPGLHSLAVRQVLLEGGWLTIAWDAQ